mmetsp:Transcript_33430/g.105953  ORF Transcript_33430/g.105953 Transcript_33430/m.105953 type:complete len:137 (-) Transcript_33430:153-563(-)
MGSCCSVGWLAENYFPSAALEMNQVRETLHPPAVRRCAVVVTMKACLRSFALAEPLHGCRLPLPPEQKAGSPSYHFGACQASAGKSSLEAEEQLVTCQASMMLAQLLVPLHLQAVLRASVQRRTVGRHPDYGGGVA